MLGSGHTHTSIDAHRDDFLKALKRRKYSARSIQAYRVGLAGFIRFLDARGLTRAQDITVEDLDAYRLHLVERRYAAATLHHYLRCLRNLFNWLEAQQRIFVNPAAALRLPRPERKLAHVPTEADIRALLAQPDVSTSVGIRDRAFLEVAYSTGCRLNELVGMNVFDPDVQQGCAQVTGKGNKERIVPLGRQAVEWLKRYLKHSRPKLLRRHLDELALWVGWHGKRINPLVIERAIRAYGQAAGIAAAITPHSLRRACATHMLRHGAHPVQIQMLLGHASLRSLSQYLRVSITDLKNAHQRSKPGR